VYVQPNYQTKKELREAVKSGAVVTILQPGPFGGDEGRKTGVISVEGPHYPEPHRWYARVRVVRGVVVEVFK
jgi:hypothetical protein